MANGIHKDLGKVTAYSYAKAAGYTGTEEQFQAIFNEFTENAPGLIDRMDTAVARAEAAVTNIDATIQDAVDDAVDEATASAVATANQAVTDAQAAQTAAEGAVTQANAAVTQANAAVTAAQAAQSAAEDAAESFVLDRTLTDSGAAAPADLVGNLKESISFFENIGIYQSLIPYLFAKNSYINSSNVVATLDGYNLYRIPFEHMDLLFMTWDANSVPWATGFNISQYAVAWENSSGVISRTYPATKIVRSQNYNFGCIGLSDSKYLYICVLSTMADKLNIQLKIKTNSVNNTPYIKHSMVLADDNCITSPIIIGSSGGLSVTDPSEYMTRWMQVKKGDTFRFEQTSIGVNWLAKFIDFSDAVTTIGNLNSLFTCPNDGIINCFDRVGENNITYTPNNSIKLATKDIIGLSEVDYSRKQGVAFGTSLTYRAISAFGYLDYLPSLSGIDFENQGLGSSTILPQSGHPEMLPIIKNYTNYATKDICILEGFVNDWWYNSGNLGTWKDNDETTVCGCVRSAINYILTQNANITLFLVLDHYGQNFNDFDSSSTAVNNDGKTQYEFYDEIAKVANSLGIIVIKQYETSEINEHTPQYLVDNIHLTAQGALQSAQNIWSGIKNNYPNVT